MLLRCYDVVSSYPWFLVAVAHDVTHELVEGLREHLPRVGRPGVEVMQQCVNGVQAVFAAVWHALLDKGEVSLILVEDGVGCGGGASTRALPLEDACLAAAAALEVFLGALGVLGG